MKWLKYHCYLRAKHFIFLKDSFFEINRIFEISNSIYLEGNAYGTSYDEVHCAYMIKSKNDKTEFINFCDFQIFESFEKKRSSSTQNEYLIKKERNPFFVIFLRNECISIIVLVDGYTITNVMEYICDVVHLFV